MSKSYQPWTQDQSYLLPPSERDWLPEDHLAWFIVEVVWQLDLSAIESAIQSKDSRGQRPYHPSMMVALLVYAYCKGVYSSRRIGRAWHEDVAFRVITGNTRPLFTTVNEFRRVHREHFGALFVDVLKLCRRVGLVKLHHVAIDGTQVKANASKHKAMSYRRMLQEERRLRAEVERLLGEAEAVDASEDSRYGAGTRADELPEELPRRESRLKRIREAKAALEVEARKTRARTLREQAEGHERTAHAHPDPVVRRRARTNATKRRAKAEEFGPGDDDPPGGGNGGGELPRKPTIVACGVTDQPSDAVNFAPMLERAHAGPGGAACLGWTRAGAGPRDEARRDRSRAACPASRCPGRSAPAACRGAGTAGGRSCSFGWRRRRGPG